MLPVNQHKATLLEEFYLDSDNITVRRAKDGWRGKYKKHDIVKPYKSGTRDYGGIHIPRTRATVSYVHLILLLRGVDIPEGYVVDHLDGDITNNQPDNLRIVSQAINCRNQKIRKTNTTGYTGIAQDSSGKYIVRRTLKGKRVYLGYTASLEKALELYRSKDYLAKLDGYTGRHGKEGATTIPKGSTPQAIGGGSAQHP